MKKTAAESLFAVLESVKGVRKMDSEALMALATECLDLIRLHGTTFQAALQAVALAKPVYTSRKDVAVRNGFEVSGALKYYILPAEAAHTAKNMSRRPPDWLDP